MQNAPYNFLRSSASHGTGIVNVGSYGYFWSSSALNINSAHRLNFGSSIISPQNSRSKGDGRSVRCVFDPYKVTPDRLSAVGISMPDTTPRSYTFVLFSSAAESVI